MGSTDFQVTSMGYTADEAFQGARQEARNEHGNNGYTGSIAEKTSFKIVKCPIGTKVQDYIDDILDNNKVDKWEPALCIIKREGKINTAASDKVKIEERIYKGTRVWSTVYVGYSGYGDQRFVANTKKHALELAKSIVLKDKCDIKIVLEKRLVDTDKIVATVKPVSVKTNSIIGEYTFFGFASC